MDLGIAMSAADVRALFPNEPWHELFELSPALEADGVRFVEGGLTVDQFLADKGPWGLVVHGDLMASGDLDFWTGDYKVSLLVVRGSVRARNVRFGKAANCFISEDLVASGYVVGRYGDESARLDVGGTLRARALLLDHVTGVTAANVDAIVVASQGWGLPLDIDYQQGAHRYVFVGEILRGDAIDLVAAWQRATRGGELFLPGVERELRARRANPSG
jgi:hypothetical protein